MDRKVKNYLLCLLYFIGTCLCATAASGQSQNWVLVYEDKRTGSDLSAVSAVSLNMPESKELLEWLWLGNDSGSVKILLDPNENRPSFRDIPIAAGNGGDATTTARQSSSINDIYFRDPKTGFLLKDNIIYQTRSGGLDWAVSYAVPQKGASNATLNSIGFFPKNQARGCVVGSYIQGDTVTGSLILCNRDVYNERLKEWRAPQGLQSNAELLHLVLVDDKHGWIVGSGGTILYTQDASETWTAQQSNTRAMLYHVDFYDSKHGWVVGEKNTILRTEDGGLTWKQVEVRLPEQIKLWSVKFIDEKRGWAVGRNGTILYTQDGGTTWASQNSPTKNDLYAISVDRRYCWIVGKGGVILRYQLER